MLTKDQAENICRIVNVIRPDWNQTGIMAILGDERLRVDRSYRAAAVAFVALALDPASRKPTRIFEHGHWWEAARPIGDQPSASAWIRTPAGDDCDICGRPPASPHPEHQYAPLNSSGYGSRLTDEQRQQLDDRIAEAELARTAAEPEAAHPTVGTNQEEA